MSLPLTGTALLVMGVVFGFIFGFLLQKGRVTDYNVIVNQFRLKDFTVLKVMFTAIIVGGIGVLILHAMGHADYHIKAANMLGVVLGSALFGVGMVLFGYCPGTGIAAVATGSIHALVGLIGMLAGGILYALSFEWVNQNILSVWALGKLRLPDVAPIPDWIWMILLVIIAAVVFYLLERKPRHGGAGASPTASDPPTPVGGPS